MEESLYNIFNALRKLERKVFLLSDQVKLLIIVFISLFFFLIIFKLNLMTPMWGDDYMYSFIYSTNERVDSLGDVITSQYNHYMLWGGRSVAHFIAQILLLLNPVIIDLLNSIIYVLFTIVIYLNIKGYEKKHDFLLIILINLFLWFFQPAYAETILWTTGSANYLWCTFIILSFILPYRFYQNRAFTGVKLYTCSFFMFLFGIISGWTNENVGIALLLILIVWCITYKQERWKIPVWAISGIIGVLIGYLFLLLAPGNTVRMESAGGEVFGLFRTYFKFNMHTARLADNIGFILVLTLILSILVLKFSTIKRVKFVRELLIYSLGVFIPVYAMIASPTFPDRAWFGTVTFSVLIFGLSFYKLNENLFFLRSIRIGIFLLFSCAFIFNFYRSYKEIKLASNLSSERVEIIQESIKENKSMVKLSPIRLPSKYVLYEDPSNIKNISLYYNIEVKLE